MPNHEIIPFLEEIYFVMQAYSPIHMTWFSVIFSKGGIVTRSAFASSYLLALRGKSESGYF